MSDAASPSKRRMTKAREMCGEEVSREKNDWVRELFEDRS